jgi:dTDP-4-amino-4,6-dideoxygalactose transaminase
VTYRIRFNQPYIAGGEGVQAARCLASGETSGDGAFSKECQRLLCGAFGARSVLLTTSCTSALELAALLCDLEPGDEVILPSYTFVSTANAFLLRGATLKFVDVRPDTLNLDEQLVAAAAGPRTKVIVAVHYAGVACEMDSIRATADRHGALVVEDAAQAVNATYKGSHLGTLAPLGAYSFHATKNFSCGEGGALVVNDARLVERAEIMREKGTNRSRFYRGQVDKYTWMDIGSSYVLSEILAAVLLVQLEHMERITAERRRVYEHYHAALAPLAERGLLTLPTIPDGCGSNYHLFHVLTENLARRTALIEHLKKAGIQAVFHYVPLHTSPMGGALGYRAGMLPVTESVSDRLLRLPLYPALTEAQVDEVAGAVLSFFSASSRSAQSRKSAGSFS